MLVSLVKGGLTDAVVSVVSEASGEPRVAQSVCGDFIDFEFDYVFTNDVGSLSEIPLCPVSNAPGKDEHLPRPSASDCFIRLEPELVKNLRGWGVPNYWGARGDCPAALTPGSGGIGPTCTGIAHSRVFDLKAVKHAVRPVLNNRAAVTFDHLKLLACNREAALGSLKIALVFGYLGLLRVSNLAPYTCSEFDPTRHTT